MNKKDQQHHQQHLFPILSSFFVVGLLVIMVQANLSYGAELVIAASVIYVITNTIYAHHERSLTLVRFIEFFASASLVAYIALTYLT